MKSFAKTPCILAFCLLVTTSSSAQTNWIPYAFTTLAGMAEVGSADGTNGAARFNLPRSVAVDSKGNVYIADQNNQTIRKMVPAGTNWVVTTIAGLAGTSGNADGTNSDARFWNPMGLAVDAAGTLYVADGNNGAIRKMTCVGTNWVVTTIAGLAGYPGYADGANASARFGETSDVAIDAHGTLYVTDAANNTIRQITPAGNDWIVKTIAGMPGYGGNGSTDGTNTLARFYQPMGLTVDRAGSIYVSDYRNFTIRKVTPAGTNWVVTTLAGLAGSIGSVDGTNSSARFYFPWGITAASTGGIYICDSRSIRKLTPSGTNWIVTTVAGNSIYGNATDGTNTAACFEGPVGITTDSAGTLFVTDISTIRKVTPVGTNWVVTTPAGFGGSAGSTEGTNSTARFSRPQGLAVDGSGNLYVADQVNFTIRKITPDGATTTLAGCARSWGTNDGPAELARFSRPVGIALDQVGNVYVLDAGSFIRQISTAGVVSTLAGSASAQGSADGTNGCALFNFANGIAADAPGTLYVADSANNTIRSVKQVGSDWIVTTLAGLAGSPGQADGTNSNARFSFLQGVAVDPSGNLFVADTGNGSIRKVTLINSNWVVSTVATGLSGPASVAVDCAGNIFVANLDATIWKLMVVGTHRVAFQLAEKALTSGSQDGVGSAARFAYPPGPSGIAVDNLGSLYVTDAQNNTIRRGFPANAAPVLGNSSFNTGRFAFSLAGATGQVAVIQTSADLTNWVCLQTNTIGSGVLRLSTPNASGQGYYRAFSP